VGVSGEWYTYASVFRSVYDRDFLKACPDQRYESLVVAVRRRFRESNPEWWKRNFAQWILALDPASESGAVHLHIYWSPSVLLRTTPLRDPGLVNAPIIVPKDLFRSDPSMLADLIVSEDFDALPDKAGVKGGFR
jgi:hypothetical protein